MATIMTKKQLASAIYDMNSAWELEAYLLPPMTKEEFIKANNNTLKAKLEDEYNEFISMGYEYAIGKDLEMLIQLRVLNQRKVKNAR